MFLRRFFNLEFGAIFFGTLYFYLLNYANSFRAAAMDGTVAMIQSLSYAVLALVVTLSFMSIWSNKHNLVRRNTLLKLVFVILLGGLLFYATKSVGVVLALPLGIMLINTSDRSIFQYIFYSGVLFFILTVALYLFGVITTAGDRIDTALFDNKENVQQLYSLGFNNPNLTYKFFMPILLSGLYLFGKRKRAIVILFLTSVYIGLLTGSTAGFAIAGMACLSFALIEHGRLKSMIRRITPHMFGILTILTFAVAIVFGTAGSLPNSVNDGLTGRPELWNFRIENGSYINIMHNNDEYSIDGFGKGNSGQGYFALDNTFLYIMVYYGLIVYALYYLLYYKSTRIIKDEKILLVGLLLLATLFIGERSDVYSNIFLLFAVKYMARHYFYRSKLNAQN